MIPSPTRRQVFTGLTATCIAGATLPARAEDREVIEARVNLALQKLYREIPGAEDLARRAKGILVMPDVIKGGFIVGGAYGEGALRLNEGGSFDRTDSFYSVGAISAGFQAGLQQTSHALFFLTD
ncbi:MAG: twin-arginine translocation pathway signal, partial [Pseudomonadota bacterium]